MTSERERNCFRSLFLWVSETLLPGRLLNKSLVHAANGVSLEVCLS